MQGTTRLAARLRAVDSAGSGSYPARRVKHGDLSVAGPPTAGGVPDRLAPRVEAKQAADERETGRPPLEPLPIAGLTRRHVALGIAALAVVWIVLVIARAVADSSATTEQAWLLRTHNEQLARRLDAARRELALVRSAPYLRLEARAYGMGGSSERAFALQPGAPRPPRITPLGADPDEGMPNSPVDDWLELLFGD